MASPLKRRAQHDLSDPPRKFCKYDPFRPYNRQPRLSSFIIHESTSFHDHLVNVLPAVADKIRSSTTELHFPTADKENINPTPVTRRRDTARRRFRGNPLQDYANTESDVGSKNKNRNKCRECWVTCDGELYTAQAGPLARSFRDELRILEWLRSNNGVSSGKYHHRHLLTVL